MHADSPTYSSYTKGIYSCSFAPYEDGAALIILPCDFESKIAKRRAKFQTDLVLSLDGVPAEILKMYVSDQALVLSCKVNSLFKVCSSQSQASVGMRSTNAKKWLLCGYPLELVLFKKIALAENHQYLQELTFECTQNQFQKLSTLLYLGLNGSGFVIQKRFQAEGKYFFSVHAGQETREKTIFYRDGIKDGQLCVLSYPKQPLD